MFADHDAQIIQLHKSQNGGGNYHRNVGFRKGHRLLHQGSIHQLAHFPFRFPKADEITNRGSAGRGVHAHATWRNAAEVAQHVFHALEARAAIDAYWHAGSPAELLKRDYPVRNGLIQSLGIWELAEVKSEKVHIR